MNCKYYGVFSSVDDLFKNYWHLGSFFVLSTYIIRRESALKYLKPAYESLIFQHPYSTMVLHMHKDGNKTEMLDVNILKLQNNIEQPRFDYLNANIDIINIVYTCCSKDQMSLFIKNDIRHFREKTIFNKNIGFTFEIDLNQVISNYKRLAHITPSFTLLNLKSRLWIIFARIRHFNLIFSSLIYFYSKINKNTFTTLSYFEINKILKNNIKNSIDLRH